MESFLFCLSSRVTVSVFAHHTCCIGTHQALQKLEIVYLGCHNDAVHENSIFANNEGKNTDELFSITKIWIHFDELFCTICILGVRWRWKKWRRSRRWCRKRRWAPSAPHGPQWGPPRQHRGWRVLRGRPKAPLKPLLLFEVDPVGQEQRGAG